VGSFLSGGAASGSPTGVNRGSGYQRGLRGGWADGELAAKSNAQLNPNGLPDKLAGDLKKSLKTDCLKPAKPDEDGVSTTGLLGLVPLGNRALNGDCPK
jgi:hypothetical protein